MNATFDENGLVMTESAPQRRLLCGHLQKLYFDLVKNFGGVPLVTGFVMPHEVEGITRSSVEECYKFIENDFRESADAEYYDLTGMKIKEPSKGIYIVKNNGKIRKVMVK